MAEDDTKDLTQETEVAEETAVEEDRGETQLEAKTETEVKAEEEAKPEDGKKKQHWAHSRINELTAQKRGLEEELKLEREKNAATVATAEKTEEITVPVDSKKLDKLVDERAEYKVRMERFNQRANEVYAAGTKEFDDFPEAVANLQAVGALGESGNPNFVSIVTELDDGHKVIHHLGQNPDEAARILALSPTKMAVELTKLETNLNSKQPLISKAPKPVKLVSGSAKTSVDLMDKEIPISQWMKERQKQLEQRSRR